MTDMLRKIIAIIAIANPSEALMAFISMIGRGKCEKLTFQVLPN